MNYRLPANPACRSICSLFIIPALFLLTGCDRNDDPKIDNVYRFNETMTIDGITRTYLLNLPPGYYNASDFSLVIAMHGGGGDAVQFETTSRLTEKANASEFIVVYPEGVQSTGLLGVRTWNAGKCCAYASATNINDVNFISQLIDKLVSTYKINPKKIYATGHSNGGMMSYRLACELSDKIAAIAPNGCTMVMKQWCAPSRAVPVLHMHSVADTNVPYEGGIGNGLTNVYFPPVDSVLNVWSLINDCTITSQVFVDDNRYKFTEWSDCSDNVMIWYYLTKDGGHG